MWVYAVWRGEKARRRDGGKAGRAGMVVVVVVYISERVTELVRRSICNAVCNRDQRVSEGWVSDRITQEEKRGSPCPSFTPSRPFSSPEDQLDRNRNRKRRRQEKKKKKKEEEKTRPCPDNQLI